MKTYILRRLLIMIPTLFGITLITFVILKLGPSDPAITSMGQGAMRAGESSQQILDEWRKRHGYDKPVPVQYALWMKKLATLDFGNSIKDQRPVWDKIKERIPITLLLSTIAIFLTYAIAIPIGVYSAIKQYSLGDKITTFALFVLYSIPNFWLAIMLIMYLGGGDYWHVFPVQGLHSDGADQMGALAYLGDAIWHLVLPVTCLTYTGLASLSRYQRSALLEVVRQDYIRTARAKGLAGHVVVAKHAMRNSLIPIVTLLGTLLPQLFGGSVIIESIFGIPGMGRLGFEAILNRDLDVVMALTVVTAVLTMAGLLLSDILYVLVDPRISFEAGAH